MKVWLEAVDLSRRQARQRVLHAYSLAAKKAALHAAAARDMGTFNKKWGAYVRAGMMSQEPARHDPLRRFMMAMARRQQRGT